jgi:tetratricopeptide (TPR) repeat protein
LARDLGAKVFDFPWQDDFAQARNAALKALKTDWVLIMDDDEELDHQARNKIPPLLGNANAGGYSVILRNYLPLRFSIGGHAPSVKPMVATIPRAEQARAYADFSLYRLFRRHAEIYYVGRVHEMVEPSIRALGMELASADFVIHHFGHLCSPQELLAKDEFYRKLGRLKIEDLPNDAQSWTEIGQLEYERLQNYSAGIACFKRALALPGHSNVPYLSLANLYVDIHADARALELLSRVSMKGRAAGAKEHIRGDALYNLGELKEARTAYTRALHVLPDDARISSKLGLTEVRLGLKKSGLARLMRASQENLEIFEMHDRLIKAYLLINMMPEAAEAAEHLAMEFPNPATISRAASIRAHMSQWKDAEEIILCGLQQFPEDKELLQTRAEIERETSRALPYR